MKRTTFKEPVFLTFEEWLKENPDIEEQEEDCEECLGTGKTDCPHCGHEMDCEECDGKGKVKTSRSLYERQREQDEIRWKRYAKSISFEKTSEEV